MDQNSTPNMLSRARKVVLFHFAIITLETSRQKLLKEVCKDIRVESQLQQLTGEILHSSTVTGNESRSDICERSFWQAGQIALLM